MEVTAALIDYGVLGVVAVILFSFAYKVYNRMAAKIEANDKLHIDLISSHGDRMEALVQETQKCIQNNTEASHALRADIRIFGERIQQVENELGEVKWTLSRLGKEHDNG